MTDPIQQANQAKVVDLERLRELAKAQLANPTGFDRVTVMGLLRWQRVHVVQAMGF